MKRLIALFGAYYIGLVLGYRYGVKKTATACSEMIADAGIILLSADDARAVYDRVADGDDCGDPNCPVHGDRGGGERVYH